MQYQLASQTDQPGVPKHAAKSPLLLGNHDIQVAGDPTNYSYTGIIHGEPNPNLSWYYNRKIPMVTILEDKILPPQPKLLRMLDGHLYNGIMLRHITIKDLRLRYIPYIQHDCSYADRTTIGSQLRLL